MPDDRGSILLWGMDYTILAMVYQPCNIIDVQILLAGVVRIFYNNEMQYMAQLLMSTVGQRVTFCDNWKMRHTGNRVFVTKIQ